MVCPAHIWQKGRIPQEHAVHLAYGYLVDMGWTKKEIYKSLLSLGLISKSNGIDRELLFNWIEVRKHTHKSEL